MRTVIKCFPAVIFHGQPIAFALDFLSIAMAELANISERRIERLVNPQLNDLPPFLSPQPGLQSGVMIFAICCSFPRVRK
ncbi:hypothetical protein GCM10020331_049790 [Ectobacillus funiculus]